MPSKEVYLGGHVSVAGGFVNGILKAKEIGANTIQIFGSSPRQWFVRMPSAESAEAFRKACAKEKMGPVFLHAPYLINLASPSEEARQKSIACLAGHYRIAEMLGAEGLVLHIGSGAEMEKKRAFSIVVKALKETIKMVPGKSFLMVENSAGGGAKIGARLEEVGEILDAVDDPRIAACFDTAHAFESGIIDGYTPANVKKLATRIEETIQWKRLKALHANDSKTAFDSHHDRHENIGEGYIGLDGFRSLMAHSKFRSIPWLLEVPGFGEEKGPDKKNVDILKKLNGELKV
jgi:deoxyribonuclease IV